MAKTSNFGKRLRFVREKRGMTQAQLAAATGINEPALSSMETGKRLPQMAGLISLCRALMVSADYLLGISERIGP